MTPEELTSRSEKNTLAISTDAGRKAFASGILNAFIAGPCEGRTPEWTQQQHCLFLTYILTRLMPCTFNQEAVYALLNTSGIGANASQFVKAFTADDKHPQGPDRPFPAKASVSAMTKLGY